MHNQKKSKSTLARILKSLLLTLILTASAFWVINNKWLIRDQFTALSYTPSAEEQQILDDLNLTKRADLTARASNFKLQPKQGFADVCPVEEYESGNVLGCYSNNMIYTLKVDDPQLSGLEQATTAHEILHAYYARLSTSKKEDLSEDLRAFYNSIKNQPEFERTNKVIEQYSEQLGNYSDEFINELFAVYGTQIPTISTTLEEYYDEVFNDRAQIVGFYSNYSAQFIKLEEQIKLFDKQLADLKQQKAEKERQLQAIEADLSSRKSKLDNPEQSYSTQAQYESAVNSYNSRVKDYNFLVKIINDVINEHNQILALRNNSALAINQLDEEISTKTSK